MGLFHRGSTKQELLFAAFEAKAAEMLWEVWGRGLGQKSPLLGLAARPPGPLSLTSAFQDRLHLCRAENAGW